MLGLSPVADALASGSGVTPIRTTGGVLSVMVPRPATPGQVDDLRSGGNAAEGEVPVFAAALAADGDVLGRVMEADHLRQARADEDRDGRLVRGVVVPRAPVEHRERVRATLDAEPRVHVVRARVLRARK